MAKNEETRRILDSMDKARNRAADTLDDMLENMSAEERKGAKAVMRWIKQNYMTAGYKRLCRYLIKEV